MESVVDIIYAHIEMKLDIIIGLYYRIISMRMYLFILTTENKPFFNHNLSKNSGDQETFEKRQKIWRSHDETGGMESNVTNHYTFP